MKTVSESELAAMDADANRAAVELADASVDVMPYACLVATTTGPPRAPSHREAAHQDVNRP